MKKLNYGHYLIMFFIVLITFFGIRGCVIQEEIKYEGKNIIVKFIKKERKPKTTHFYFGYYYNGQYFETLCSEIKYSVLNSEEETKLIDSLEVNSFYKAKFNEKYPESIIVDPSKKITDTVGIKLAGFKVIN